MAAPQREVDQGNSVVEVVCEMCLLSNIVVIILVKKILRKYIASDLAFRVILNSSRSRQDGCTHPTRRLS